MKSKSALPAHSGWKALLPALALLAPGLGAAAELVVRVGGLAEPLGRVGCSLFAGASGFPLDSAQARVQWHAADAKGVVCRYADLPAGSYAVSIVHDRNGNQRVDTNLVGLPTEPWGVSNNVRPSLRAPRFDEAAFKVPADERDLLVLIQVAR
jgi:uncharacterized protein (DUF2141 family)